MIAKNGSLTMAAVANVRLPTEKAHGIQIMAMCAAFAAAGMRVNLIAPRRAKNPLAGDPFAFYGTPRTFAIRTVPTLDLLPWQRVLGPLAFWVERISFVLAALAVARRHAAAWTRDELFAVGWVMLHRAPIVLEVHAPSARAAWAYRAVSRRGRIVAISEGVRDALVGFGVRSDRITVLHDAVDAARFRPGERGAARTALDLPADKKLVVYTGHLYPWKGARVLADASALFPSDTEAVIVGGTEQDLAAFRHFLVQRNLSRVRLVGRRPPPEMPLWLSAADVVVIPTSGKEPIGSRYTSPLKLFEAMAARRPIIASDLPSLREVLTDGTNAILVQPDNPAALAAGVRRILGDADLANRIADHAYADAGQYTWTVRAAAILALLAG